MKRCSRCGETKPLEAFPTSQGNPTARARWCLECGREYNRAYYQTHKAETLARARRWRAEHRDRWRELNRQSARRQKARRVEQSEAPLS